MRLVVLTVVACVLGAAAVLFALMFRRNQGIHGLAAFTLAICAGCLALIYAAASDE